MKDNQLRTDKRVLFLRKPYLSIFFLKKLEKINDNLLIRLYLGIFCMHGILYFFDN